MLITVTWHDPEMRSKVVEVRDRGTDIESYFLNGLLNQAMRQAGYTEEVIHAQHFVGPVEFVFEEKAVKPQIIAVPSTLAECRPDQIENWWAAYVSARGG